MCFLFHINAIFLTTSVTSAVVWPKWINTEMNINLGIVCLLNLHCYLFMSYINLWLSKKWPKHGIWPDTAHTFLNLQFQLEIVYDKGIWVRELIVSALFKLLRYHDPYGFVLELTIQNEEMTDTGNVKLGMGLWIQMEICQQQPRNSVHYYTQP